MNLCDNESGPFATSISIDGINFVGVSQAFAQATKTEFEQNLITKLATKNISNYPSDNFGFSKITRQLSKDDFQSPKSLGNALAHIVSEALAG